MGGALLALSPGLSLAFMGQALGLGFLLPSISVSSRPPDKDMGLNVCRI